MQQQLQETLKQQEEEAADVAGATSKNFNSNKAQLEKYRIEDERKATARQCRKLQEEEKLLRKRIKSLEVEAFKAEARLKLCAAEKVIYSSLV